MDNQLHIFDGDYHPPKEQLLLYVDGELTLKEAARLQSHLDACWSCRIEINKIEETIAGIMGFEAAVSEAQNSRPSKTWGDFNSRLNVLVQESQNSSTGKWNFDNIRRQFILISSGPAKRFAVGGLAALLIFAVFYQFVFVPPVSASELLNNAENSRSESLKSENNPVVYQKLKISGSGNSTVFELWNEVSSARNKLAANSQNEILNRYENVLAINGFDPLKPLSAQAYRLWREKILDKSDTTALVKTNDGSDAIKLTTIVSNVQEIGKITQATLTVRADNWHPTAQTIEFKTASGLESIEISEIEYRVLNRQILAKDFFGETSPFSKQIAQNNKAGKTANANQSPFPSLENNSISANSNAANTAAPQASSELEVEVLSLLNQAKADLGEQINVRREAGGQLYVGGIVESAKRKKEILEALQPLKNNSAVKIDLKTIDEAVAEQKKTPQPSTKAEIIENQAGETATNSELLAYFKTEEAARQFGKRMISRSRSAMAHAYALKRLAGQFKAEELRGLSPGARAKWLSLINLHARGYLEETGSLRRDLQPVFGIYFSGSADAPEINSITEVPRAAEKLLSLATTSDQIIVSAFSLSSDGAKFTAIKTLQFRQTLQSAEAAAAKLQSVK